MLHYRYPERESFSCTDIVSHVIERRLTVATERLVVQYVDRLVVSNRKPETVTERASMLFALPDGSRRLYRSLDHAEKVLWVLRSGARAWSDLPERCGKYKSVHARFMRWARSGVGERIFNELVNDKKNQ